MIPRRSHRIAKFRFPLLLGCAVLLGGCGYPSGEAPTSPRQASSEVLSIAQPAGISAADFRPIAFRRPSRDTGPARKPAFIKKVISAKQGGQLLLDWESKDQNGVTGTKVKAEVKILPGGLEQDTEISIYLDNAEHVMITVNLEFGKHGTAFLIPAEVKLDIWGLDFSGYGPTDVIDLYWYDPDAETWFPVPKEFKKVNRSQGKVEGIWYFEHFSRYSLSGGGYSDEEDEEADDG